MPPTLLAGGRRYRAKAMYTAAARRCCQSYDSTTTRPTVMSPGAAPELHTHAATCRAVPMGFHQCRHEGNHKGERRRLSDREARLGMVESTQIESSKYQNQLNGCFAHHYTINLYRLSILFLNKVSSAFDAEILVCWRLGVAVRFTIWQRICVR